MARIEITFTATVNGSDRTVTFPLDVSVSQLVRGGMEWLEGEAEMWINNDQGLYNEFYADADDADYDAEWEDIRVDVEDED